jgi:hypothetical protein
MVFNDTKATRVLYTFFVLPKRGWREIKRISNETDVEIPGFFID